MDTIKALLLTATSRAKWSFVTLALAVSLVASFTAAAPTRAVSAAPITGLAGKCLDVQGGVAQAKNAVQLYSCNSTIAQQWEQPGDGTIRNQGLCLDVAWGSKTAESLVWLYDCNGTPAQQWKVNADGTLASVLSSLCLDDAHASTADRNPVWIYDCNATQAQHWMVSAIVVTPTSPESTSTPTTSAPAQTAPSNSSTGNGYTNVDGNHVNSPSSDPAGATAQCKDGTYSYSQHRSGTCSYHGGVARWL
jgi:hypothetical protein